MYTWQWQSLRGRRGQSRWAWLSRLSPGRRQRNPRDASDHCHLGPMMLPTLLCRPPPPALHLLCLHYPSTPTLPSSACSWTRRCCNPRSSTHTCTHTTLTATSPSGRHHPRTPTLGRRHPARLVLFGPSHPLPHLHQPPSPRVPRDTPTCGALTSTHGSVDEVNRNICDVYEIKAREI